MRFVTCACCLWLAAGTSKTFARLRSILAPNVPSRLISQLANLLQNNPQRDETWSSITNAIISSVLAKEYDIRADLSDTDKYLAYFAGALKYSISPHARRPQHTDRLGIYTRVGAWNWATKTMKEDVGKVIGCMLTALGRLRMFSHAFYP